MTLTKLRTAVAVGVCAAALPLLVGCSSSESPKPETSNTLTPEQNAGLVNSADDLATYPEQLNFLREGFTEYAAIFDQAYAATLDGQELRGDEVGSALAELGSYPDQARLVAVNAPAELAAAHEELVAALQDAADAALVLADPLAETPVDPAMVPELLDTFRAAAMRVSAAFSALA